MTNFEVVVIKKTEEYISSDYEYECMLAEEEYSQEDYDNDFEEYFDNLDGLLEELNEIGAEFNFMNPFQRASTKEVWDFLQNDTISNRLYNSILEEDFI